MTTTKSTSIGNHYMRPDRVVITTRHPFTQKVYLIASLAFDPNEAARGYYTTAARRLKEFSKTELRTPRLEVTFKYKR